MDASEHTRSIFRGRAYGLDIRVEREADGTLSVYGSEPYADDYALLARGPVEEMVGRFDVSGGCGAGSSGRPERPPLPSAVTPI